jgi:energy-coupling factor transporter ATP-binding protein EcfA2
VLELKTPAVTVGSADDAAGTHTLVRDVDVVLERGEKVALLGANGSGKTTLIETVAGLRSLAAGASHLGHNVRPAYYSQQGRELREEDTVLQTVLLENQAIGGAGGVGGSGGNGQGGGIWNGTPNPSTGAASILTVRGSTIVGNRADGGAAGVGGSDGQGVGGGIYIVPGGTVCVDLATVITDNDASDSDDDVFGNLCFI